MSNGNKPDFSTPAIIQQIDSYLRANTAWYAQGKITDPITGNADFITGLNVENVTFPPDPAPHITWAVAQFRNDAAASGLFDSNDPRVRALLFATGGNPLFNMLLFNSNTNAALQSFVTQIAESFFGPGAANFPEVLLALSQWFATMSSSPSAQINVFGIPTAARTPLVSTGAGAISATVPPLFSILSQVAQMMALKNSNTQQSRIDPVAAHNIFANVFDQGSFKDRLKEGGATVTWQKFVATATGTTRPVPSMAIVLAADPTKSLVWDISKGRDALTQWGTDTGLRNESQLGTHFHVRYGGLRAFAQAFLVLLQSFYDKTGAKFTNDTAQKDYDIIKTGAGGWLKAELSDN